MGAENEQKKKLTSICEQTRSQCNLQLDDFIMDTQHRDNVFYFLADSHDIR